MTFGVLVRDIWTVGCLNLCCDVTQAVPVAVVASASFASFYLVLALEWLGTLALIAFEVLSLRTSWLPICLFRRR